MLGDTNPLLMFSANLQKEPKMHAWTNENTGHNRIISTGPTPDGKVPDLVFTVVYETRNDGATIDKAINLDNHVIPLILRVPEMRECLLECEEWLEELETRYESRSHPAKIKLQELIRRIEALTALTSEESEHA